MSLDFLLIPADGPRWSWSAAAVAFLARERPARLGGGSLAQLLGLSPATARRDLAAALEAGGIVRERDGRLRPGPAWTALRASARLVSVPSWLLARRDLTRAAKLCAAKLLRDAERWAHSIRSLAADLGCRLGTVRNAFRALERAGLLVVEGLRVIRRDRLDRPIRVPGRRVLPPPARNGPPGAARSAQEAPGRPRSRETARTAHSASEGGFWRSRSKSTPHALIFDPPPAQKRHTPEPSSGFIPTTMVGRTRHEDGPQKLGGVLSAVLGKLAAPAAPRPSARSALLRAAEEARDALARGEAAPSVLGGLLASVGFGDRERGGPLGALDRFGLRADLATTRAVAVLIADLAAAGRLRNPPAVLRKRLSRLAREGLRAAVSRSCPASLEGAIGRCKER